MIELKKYWSTFTSLSYKLFNYSTFKYEQPHTFDFSIGCIVFIELWSPPKWKHTKVLHIGCLGIHFSQFFNNTLFQLICENDEFETHVKNEFIHQNIMLNFHGQIFGI
jgi:hypothetical protein